MTALGILKDEMIREALEGAANRKDPKFVYRSGMAKPFPGTQPLLGWDQEVRLF